MVGSVYPYMIVFYFEVICGLLIDCFALLSVKKNKYKINW